MAQLTIERRLGRCPSPPEKVSKRLRLTEFADVPYILPRIPPDFGHEMVRPANGWGMNGNDRLGDCVWAGAYHEHDLWSGVNGRTFRYTDKQVINAYSAVTGFDPKQTDAAGNNPTDNGTDMAAAASYRRKTGIADSTGHRRKIDAYVSLEPGNWEQLRVCMYLFGAAGIGMLWYNANWDQITANKPMDYDPKSRQDGGHYLPGVGERGQTISTVTWGSLKGMTRRCYDMQVDEALGYVSKDYLNRKGKTPEGFDLPALLKAVAAVTKVQEPTA